jgi:dienelactone hydrolase
MFKWFGLLGLALWMAGTAVAFHLLFAGVRSQRVALRLADATPIHGTLYRTRSGDTPAPGVVVLHGLAVSHQSCVPGLAVPLARNANVVLAIDLLGHGRSGGRLPAGEEDNLEGLLHTLSDHPEVDAAIDFLKSLPFVDTTRLALVGHSRGGWAAVNVGYRRDDIGSVVAISTAPGSCNQERPHNLLLLAGDRDGLISVPQCQASLERATGGSGRDPNVLYGQLPLGTARELIVAEWVNHLSQLADPLATRRTVQWVGYSFCRDPGPVPGEQFVLAIYGVLVATLGGLAGQAWILKGLARRLLMQESLPPAPGASRRPFWRIGMVLLLLLPAAPLGVRLGGRLPTGGVLFASYAVMFFLTVAVACLAGGWIGVRDARMRCSTPAALRGMLLGLASFGVSVCFLGITWGITWLDLVPTKPRLGLALVLLGLFLPCGFALAQGLRWTFGQIGSPQRAAVVRGLVWLAVVIAFWLGHCFFVQERRPLLTVPVSLLAISFLLGLPLWLLSDRPGMSVARAVNQAGLAAWLLACHLPFVQTG